MAMMAPLTPGMNVSQLGKTPNGSTFNFNFVGPAFQANVSSIKGYDDDTKSLLIRSMNGPFSVLSRSKLKNQTKMSKHSSISDNSMITTKRKR